MPPTNPVLRDDNASRVGGQTGCRLSQVLQAALTSIGETKQRMSAPKPAGKFKCDDCGRLFSTKGNMMRHVQATHAGDGVKVFPCLVCGRKFKRREDLVTHGRVHTGQFLLMTHACSTAVLSSKLPGTSTYYGVLHSILLCHFVRLGT